ncbi:MAG: hypothetical protein K2K74_09680 [Lachnospiraceae bacterium]|nr:hypothetical protein [Lachnospiraceae bacterium]
MDLIQIKIEKDSSIVNYIKIIRKFDHSLPVGAIKQRIEENDFVMGFDLEYYDVLEDMDGIDRKKIFRDMLGELCRTGARISIYQDGKMISMEILDHRLSFLEEISKQVERDIERELGYE